MSITKATARSTVRITICPHLFGQLEEQRSITKSFICKECNIDMKLLQKVSF